MLFLQLMFWEDIMSIFFKQEILNGYVWNTPTLYGTLTFYTLASTVKDVLIRIRNMPLAHRLLAWSKWKDFVYLQVDQMQNTWFPQSFTVLQAWDWVFMYCEQCCFNLSRVSPSKNPLFLYSLFLILFYLHVEKWYRIY